MRYFINPQHTFIQQLRFLMNYVIKKLFIFCFLIKLYLFSVQPISAKLFRNLKFIIKKSKANIMYGKCILILLRDFLTLKIKAHKATQPREYTCRIFPFKMNLYSTLQFLCNCCLLYILNLKFLLPPPPPEKIFISKRFSGGRWVRVSCRLNNYIVLENHSFINITFIQPSKVQFSENRCIYGIRNHLLSIMR